MFFHTLNQNTPNYVLYYYDLLNCISLNHDARTQLLYYFLENSHFILFNFLIILIGENYKGGAFVAYATE